MQTGSGPRYHRRRVRACVVSREGGHRSHSQRDDCRCGTGELDMEPQPQNTTVTLPQRVAMLFRALSIDPVGVAKALPGEWRQKQMKSPYAESDFERDWYERLHG